MMDLILQTIINGALLGGIYALLASGLSLIYGVMRIANFCHGELLMLGMYLSYWLYTLYRIDPFLSIFINAAVLFIIGMIIQNFFFSPILSAPHHNQFIVALSLILILQNMALISWKADFRSINPPYSSDVIYLWGIPISFLRLVSFIVALVTMSALYLFLTKTNTGKAIRATAQDSEEATLLGVNTHRIHLLTYGIGASLAGVAASLFVSMYCTTPYIGGPFLTITFVIIVLAGMGNVLGVFFSAILVGVLESISAVVISVQYKEIVPFVILLIVLFIKPSGLFGKMKI